MAKLKKFKDPADDMDDAAFEEYFKKKREESLKSSKIMQEADEKAEVETKPKPKKKKKVKPVTQETKLERGKGLDGYLGETQELLKKRKKLYQKMSN